jgi:hypothetical protein
VFGVVAFVSSVLVALAIPGGRWGVYLQQTLALAAVVLLAVAIRELWARGRTRATRTGK